MNQLVASSEAIQSRFDLEVIALQFASSVGDIGRPGLSKAVKFFKTWVALLRALLLRRPSRAYFTFSPTGLAFWRDLAFVALLKTFRVHVLYHLHGKGLGRGNATAIQRFWYRWAFRGSTVILLSPSLYAEIADIVPRQSCRFIANGVPDMTRGHFARLHGGGVRAPRVLFLSNMVPEKGIYDLAEAARILQDEGSELEVVFVGPFLNQQVREAFLEFIRNNKLEAVVTCTGPAYGSARVQHLLEADLFAFPSYYGPEAFPLVILEAMSAGLPVVASANGAIPEIVDDGVSGYIVPTRDAKALAAAIRQLVTDADRRERMGAEARKKYVDKYQVTIFLRRIEEVLAESTGLGAGQRTGPASVEGANAKLSKDTAQRERVR